MKYLLIYIVKKYQKNKPSSWYGCCIYEPSCSNYALIALEKYNFAKATILTIKRIKRCDHLHEGGVDLP
jgi:putative membrane protein insertion efficiency factor